MFICSRVLVYSFLCAAEFALVLLGWMLSLMFAIDHAARLFLTV